MGGRLPIDQRSGDHRHHHNHSHQHTTKFQQHFVAATGEFVGTFMFLFMGYAGHLMILDQVATDKNSVANTSLGFLQTMAVGFTYGFSLLVSVWAFYRISGGLFNPAVCLPPSSFPISPPNAIRRIFTDSQRIMQVTLGLCLSNQLPWIRAAFLMPTQLVACICAGGVVRAMFPGNLAEVNTILAPGVNIAQGVFAEMFFTAYLVFVVLMLAAEKSRDTFIAPVGIGLALLVAEIPGVYYTGGSLNPARSFGCAVASASFPSYHWIYWVGPVLGAIVSAAYFRFVKAWHYEEANPGQDAECEV
ncbi:aquaporin rerated protein [Apiospora phragmitis]|uniref:Aquaporin rerated protein n=1 Tax=Apiospora phragmitis TaxID=2905665 RepID=A0ABR1SUN7_9PEZI